MAKLALLISLIALGVAVLAYKEAGGSKDLSQRLETLRQETLDGLGKVRQETADGLSKMGKALRPEEAAKAKP
jgi:hypothetical protein